MFILIVLWFNAGSPAALNKSRCAPQHYVVESKDFVDTR